MRPSFNAVNEAKQEKEQVSNEERPIALRQCLNLLRATKRYRSDAADLEDALQPRLMRAPLLPAELTDEAAPETFLVEAAMLPSPPGPIRMMMRLDDAVAAFAKVGKRLGVV